MAQFIAPLPLLVICRISGLMNQIRMRCVHPYGYGETRRVLVLAACLGLIYDCEKSVTPPKARTIDGCTGRCALNVLYARHFAPSLKFREYVAFEHEG